MLFPLRLSHSRAVDQMRQRRAEFFIGWQFTGFEQIFQMRPAWVKSISA
jgi:hypothetical protein